MMVFDDLLGSGGFFLEEVDQGHHGDLHQLHFAITINVHHRKEGNLSGRMDLVKIQRPSTS